METANKSFLEFNFCTVPMCLSKYKCILPFVRIYEVIMGRMQKVTLIPNPRKKSRKNAPKESYSKKMGFAIVFRR